MKLEEKMKIWTEVKKRFALTDTHIQMARELNLDPCFIEKFDNSDKERWKLPLAEYISKRYSKTFGKIMPAMVVPIDDLIRKKTNKKKFKVQQKLLVIPEELQQKISESVKTIAARHQKNVTVECKKCFVFIREAGIDMCRLKYLGTPEIWGFSVFKKSINEFASGEPGFPLRDSLEKCIESLFLQIHLKAY